MPKGLKMGVSAFCLMLHGVSPAAGEVFSGEVGPTLSAQIPTEQEGKAGVGASEMPEELTQETPSRNVPGLDEPVQPHPEGDAAIHRLRSPFCPGLMLEVCPTPRAKLLRDSLQMMAWEGAQADSIVSWMLASYGEEYRGVPRTSGGGLLAWLMPPFALLGGLLALSITLHHFRRRQEPAPLAVPPLSEEDESLLAAALEELKASEEVPF
jgi:cytochrome c-type biogenesis protein CcmH/NrfF